MLIADVINDDGGMGAAGSRLVGDAMAVQILREPAAPTNASLQRIDAAAACIRAEYRQRAELFEDYFRTHRQRLAFDLDLLGEHAPAAGVVLDVGSTPLLFSGAAVSSGMRVIGVDIDPKPFQPASAALGLELRACNVETEPLPVESGSVDVVVFNEVFEHLRVNPIYTFAEVRRVLKPGGALLLSTPNLKSLRGMINFMWHDQAHSCCGDVYSQYAMLGELGHMGHTREYTRTEVRRFLERSGFVVEACLYRGGFHSRLARMAGSVLPQLRPFMSLIARKGLPDSINRIAGVDG